MSLLLPSVSLAVAFFPCSVFTANHILISRDIFVNKTPKSYVGKGVPSVVSPVLSLANRALANYMRAVLALEVVGEAPVAIDEYGSTNLTRC